MRLNQALSAVESWFPYYSLRSRSLTSTTAV